MSNEIVRCLVGSYLDGMFCAESLGAKRPAPLAQSKRSMCTCRRKAGQAAVATLNGGSVYSRLRHVGAEFEGFDGRDMAGLNWPSAIVLRSRVVLGHANGNSVKLTLAESCSSL